MSGTKSETGQILVLGAIVALFFAALFVLLFAANVQKPLDHDEHQFVASGALLAERGLLPYRDYAYFHVPNLAFVYAALFGTSRHYLLAARLFSTVCAWLGLILVFAIAYRLFHAHRRPVRLLIAAGAVILLATNPLFTYTSGKAWNHDLPLLLALAAFLLLSRSARGGRGRGRGRESLFWTGFLVGLAAGTRLSFILLLLPFLAMTLAHPAARTWRARWAFAAWLALGAAVALLPALVLFVLAPEQFLFGNLEYARYNTLYRREMGFHPGDVSDVAMSLGGKFQYLARYVVSAPGNLLLFLAFLFFPLALNLGRLRRTPPYWFEISLSLALFPFLLLGALAPTPAFFQYFYALVPFLLLGVLYGLAALRDRAETQRWGLALLALIVVLAGAYGAKSYETVDDLFTLDDWLPIQVHRTGQEIGVAVGGGRVLTLAPLYPLEGGADIYEEFATGSFAWRVAPFVPQAQRQAAGLVAPADLGAFLAAEPPAAIHVGHEGALEEPLVRYAQEHGYQPRSLRDGTTLWLAGP